MGNVHRYILGLLCLLSLLSFEAFAADPSTLPQLKWREPLQFAAYDLTRETVHTKQAELDVGWVEGSEATDSHPIRDDEDAWWDAHVWLVMETLLVVLLLVAVLMLLFFRRVLRERTSALMEREMMWRHFIDIADVGIYVHRHGRLLFANNYVLERMQLPLDQAVGADLSKYIHPEDLQAVGQRLHAIMTEDVVIYSQPVRYLNESGDIFEVEVSSRRIQYEGEAAILGVVRDVGERNKADAALKQSASEYRQLFENLPDGIGLHQMGKWCLVNPAVVKLFGAKDASEILGRSVLKFVHPEYRQLVVDRMRAEFEQGQDAALLEEQLLRVDGTSFWAEVTGIPTSYQGEAAALVLARDITSRKVAELKLQESEQLMRQEKRKMQVILDNAPIGIWMTDMQEHIDLVNKAFSDAMGISPEDFVARQDSLSLLPESVANTCRVSERRCRQEKGVVLNQEVMPCADGKVRTFEVIKAPIFGDDDVMIGIVGIAIDATQRLAAEEEKLQLQRQMEHTQKLESLGVLAGGIAHDFNNILAVIMGNAGLLECKLDATSELMPYLNKITDASDKAALLCRQMLAYSGRGKFVVRPLNLTAMVKDITSLLQVSIQVGVELSYQLDESLPLMDADEAQIQQVLMNLVINASEAMEKKEGHIRLTTSVEPLLEHDLSVAIVEPEVMHAHYVCLTVSDDGCGMDAAVKAKIFDPFFTTKFTGRGLGMSAILGIVHAHQGCICLHSEKGQGSTFRLFFPISEARGEDERVVDGMVHEEMIVSGGVLVVDDDAMIRESASMMLEMFGYQMFTAVDGQDGVEVYREHQHEIDVVLLDMTMPEMNGVACFKALHAMNPAVKVLLSSGYQEQEATDGFVLDGLAGFVQKPYRPMELEKALLAAKRVG